MTTSSSTLQEEKSVTASTMQGGEPVGRICTFDLTTAHHTLGCLLNERQQHSRYLSCAHTK